MGLPSLSLRRPVFAIVINIIIILFGVIGYTFLGVREYPSLDPPVINVRTSYTGANADIIESQITEPLENAINGVQGIRTISSASNQGSSNITVEFDLGADLETAANDVRDKVSQAIRLLPQDIDASPVVSKADANSDAIISMTIQSDSKNVLELTDYAVNVLQERVQTIPGVSSIQIWGQKKYAMRLWFDPQKLAAYQLTAIDVQNALNKTNVELPSGKIAGQNTELTVNTLGRINTPDEFNNMIIKDVKGKAVRLKDIGYATLGTENFETSLKNNAVGMVALALVPQPGANYVEISDEFYKRLEKIKKEIPSDIKLDIALDNTVFVKNSILEVKETLFIAIVLVVIIIYLFFRDWVIAIRPLIDIPVSLIGAFFIMYIFGFTINVLTLLAIVLATGLVVDDGIVVTENIFKKLEAGMPKMQAAREGSEEIFFAVISTSITLAIVFLPIVFMQGFVGSLFKEFGIVVAGAVLISAFVSLTLTPVLNVILGKKVHKNSWFYDKTEPFFKGMEDGYRDMLNSFMKKRLIAIPIVVLCLALIYFIGKNLQSELAPMEDRGAFRTMMSAPEGTSYTAMQDYVDKVSEFVIDSVPEQRLMLSVTSPGFTGSGAANSAFMRIGLKDKSERTRSQDDIAQYLQRNFSKFNLGKAFVIQDQTISVGSARFGQPVQFVIQNFDFEKLQNTIPKFMEEVSKSPVFIGADVNLKFNKPEVNVIIDKDKATALGVSVQDIAQTLQFSMSGRRFGYFLKDGKQYQIIGQAQYEERNKPEDLKNIYVRNNTGALISLDNLIRIEELAKPPQLYHYDRYKSATVSSGLVPGKTVGDGIAEMERIAKQVLDESFTTSLSGTSRDFAESSSNTMFALILALVLIYLVLAAQFESFIDPFIIMMTVPLALAGALLSLWIFGQTLNIFSQIGMIMLIGLVTKNGILIVEFANQSRAKGMGKSEAVAYAAVMRLRPILMTSLAMALGAVPIAIAFGAGSTSRVSLGIVIIGGIMFSLILTLFVVPAIYSLLSRTTVKTVE
ncbi:MAG TPA: efflux RND transporter permease subunit [Chitinophagales bacterium]|nr:efflux RND transporter permease subunit [Chitinophagales bacterium]HNF51299.1 efflux RND transporter permease subunit [Chitinophagales bacterium]HNO02832.1 efflux RND transporter permease subunit [Chitinophagales bacterium]